MISRLASVAIAHSYINRFSSVSHYRGRTTSEEVHDDELYDFLYESEYEAWFCNLAKNLDTIRSMKEFFLQIHTGESISTATNDWSWVNRQKLGQRLLCDLAEDMLIWYETIRPNDWEWKQQAEDAEELTRRLELDGYIFREGKLLLQQSDVLDVDQERSILKTLYQSAGLQRSSEAFQFLTQAEENFVGGR